MRAYTYILSVCMWLLACECVGAWCPYEFVLEMSPTSIFLPSPFFCHSCHRVSRGRLSPRVRASTCACVYGRQEFVAGGPSPSSSPGSDLSSASCDNGMRLGTRDYVGTTSKIASITTPGPGDVR